MSIRVAVVGAGISGLTAARELTAAGWSVTVYERGRGPGGRAAHRRAEGWAFDHGAQYFTARDPRFISRVERWREHGTVAPWQGQFAVAGNGTVEPRQSGTLRYVGTPGMNAIAKVLAQDLATDAPIRTGHTVTALQRETGGGRNGSAPWYVTVSASASQASAVASQQPATEGPYDAVILAAPPPQWLPLLTEQTSFHEAARSVTFLPTWAAMVGLKQELPLPAEGIFIDDPVLSWAARNSAKPGREGKPAWVLHANPDWAAGKEDYPPEEILPVMIEAFARATGVEIPRPGHAVAHRWRYSRPTRALGVGALWDADLRIGACGDWCESPRIEGAYLSGMAVATAFHEGMLQ